MKNLFFIPEKKIIIGMVHVRALPGTPNHNLNINKIIEKAVEEAHIYEDLGLDGIIIENMHDIPYLKGKIGHEITAAMAVISSRITQAVEIPCGVQVLAAGNKEALAIALASGCEFIRVENFVFAHIADEGLIEGEAGELLRYRKNLNAEKIAILADVKKKHSAHSITSDVSISEMVRSVEFFQGDGVIITGRSTADEPNLRDLEEAHSSTNLPVFVGSGITLENINKLWNTADGFIIGSYFKEDGDWQKVLSKSRIKDFMEKIKKIRS